MKINIKVNGDKEEVEANAISVAELLKVLETKDPDQVIIQVNEDFVEKKDFEKAIVASGDEVDILYSMGGGKI